MVEWIKEKWRIVVSAAAALIAGLFVLLRMNASTNAQKKMLQNAKDAHKAELEAAEKAKTSLAHGTKEIEADTEKSLASIAEKASKEEKALQDEKKKFVEELFYYLPMEK